jgi:hypothetical protein
VFYFVQAHAHTMILSLVYRDTKPQNAGFDVRGDIKVGFQLTLAYPHIIACTQYLLQSVVRLRFC